MRYVWFGARKPPVWDEKHVFITGGSEGLGLELAYLFLEENAKVTIVSRSNEKLKTAKDNLLARTKLAGGRICTHAVDVTSFTEVCQAVAAAEAHLGPIDVVIANAGCPSSGLFEEMDVEAYEAVMRVNFFGVMNTLKAGTAGMLKRGRGHIIIVSSLVAFSPMPGYTAYAASKCAVRGLADALRFELSIAYPGQIETALLHEMDMRTRAMIAKMPAIKTCSAARVAQLMLRGVEQGQYILLFPDLGSTFVLASNSGTAPSPWPAWLAAPAAFCTVLAQQLVVRPRIERFFRKAVRTGAAQKSEKES